MFSLELQESVRGNWHIPITAEDENTPKPWICVTRPGFSHL